MIETSPDGHPCFLLAQAAGDAEVYVLGRLPASAHCRIDPGGATVRIGRGDPDLLAGSQPEVAALGA